MRRLKEEIAALKSDNAKLQAETEDLKYRTEFKDTLSSLWQHQAEYWKTQATSRDDTIKYLKACNDDLKSQQVITEEPHTTKSEKAHLSNGSDDLQSKIIALGVADSKTAALEAELATLRPQIDTTKCGCISEVAYQNSGYQAAIREYWSRRGL